MIIPHKLNSDLLSVGYYTSPFGGSAAPACICADNMFFELITEGAVYGFEDEPQLHGVGSIFAHRPGEFTISRTQGSERYRCLTVRFDWDASQVSVDWPRCFLWDDAKAVLKFSDEMLFSYHHQVLDRSVIGDYIWNQFRFRLEDSKRHTQQDQIPMRLKAVMSYIDRNFREAISVENVAAHVGLSSSHLYARFREYLNLTPHQYLIRTRMRAAAHLLVSSDRPIKVIACDVGYVNTESFCRAFKKHYNRTAAAHRKLYRHYYT
jgi:AraC-like DNA-binding protein